MLIRRGKKWRRRSESNRWIKVLQTSALPLGYAALILKRKAKAALASCSSVGLRPKTWSGRRDLNPRLRPWQGRTLPLSYSRSASLILSARISFCQPKPSLRKKRSGHKTTHL